MDIKIEFGNAFTLCHGCLSGDRKLVRITGDECLLFYNLRGDINSSNNEPHLCWECMGTLHKLKAYQSRIRTAHQLLLQYIQSCYQNVQPRTLSHYKTKTYNFDFDDFKNKIVPIEIEINEEKNITESLNEPILPLLEPILNNIKQEDCGNDINDIKEEYYNDDDDEHYNDEQGFNDLDLKNESDLYNEYPTTDKIKLKKKFNRTKCKINKNKLPLYVFKKYVTVTDRADIDDNMIENYYNIVHLSYMEYEEFFYRFRKKIGYKALQYKCVECKLGYKRRIDVLRHNALKHDKTPLPHPCTVCQTPINTQNELTQHWQEVHTKMYQCVLCGELCVCKQQITKHRHFAHTKVYSCNVCSMEFRTMRHFSDHYQKEHDRAICDYCGKSYFANSKRLLASHIKRNHLPGYCKTCNRPYKSLAAFEYHAKIFHPELIQEKVKKELCYCVECDLQFPSVTRYKRHLAESVKHTERKKIRVGCPACDKTFAKRTTMNCHYKLYHSNDSKHYCQLCDKYFARGFGLRTHILRVHEKQRMPKDKICDLCGRGFGTLRILENHRRTHTGERPFKCGYCPASFAQKYAMTTHQKKQHENIQNMEFAIK